MRPFPWSLALCRLCKDRTPPKIIKRIVEDASPDVRNLVSVLRKILGHEMQCQHVHNFMVIFLGSRQSGQYQFGGIIQRR